MIDKNKDKAFILKQKEILTREKIKLAKELKTLEKFPSYGDSEEENAMEVEDYEGNLGLKKGASSHYKQIITALKKIEKGTYGKCESCKSVIEKGRLEAYPAASTCVSCSKKTK